MSSLKKPDFSSANEELKVHLPLLIRWGVACLMVIAGLVALAAKGEGEVNFFAAATFLIVWLGCLWKAGQSAFVVAAVLIEKQQGSKPDSD